jgi:hypothetical protein
MTQPNEPAFFNPTRQEINGLKFSHEGLSKREYFAAMALQGKLAAHNLTLIDPEYNARAAVKLADELIKALNEKNDI